MKDNTYQYYAGNMVYKNDKSLSYLLFDEGLVTKTSSVYSYEYHLKDHPPKVGQGPGNTRVTFQPNGNSITTTQVAEYYPFGSSYLPVSPAGTNKYLYNGKEKQDDVLGGTALDWYDYGARFYDPAIGRWNSMDPLAEKYRRWSPYNYCVNNPMRFIDPDGKEIKINREIINGRTTIVIDVTGKLVDKSSSGYSADKLQGYASRIESSISNSFTWKGDDIDFKANVSITVASDKNPLSSSDHAFNIYDKGEVPGAIGDNKILGGTVKGSKEISISSGILDNKPATEGLFANTGKTENGEGTLERSSAHELGHDAMLDHPAHGSSPQNLMNQTQDNDAGTKINKSLVLQMEKACIDDKLNK